MIIKLITFLFGKLSPEQKQEILKILTELIKSAAAGAVSGAMKQ